MHLCRVCGWWLGKHMVLFALFSLSEVCSFSFFAEGAIQPLSLLEEERRERGRRKVLNPKSVWDVDPNQVWERMV